MKQIFMAIVLCLVCTMSFGQKTFSSEQFVVETEDEFGEKTGKIKVGILATGYFSNSATTNSCAQLMINIMEGHSWFSLYEYCNNHASHDDFLVTFIGTKTKKEVSTTHEIPVEFIELCSENDTINVKLYGTESYSSTTAVFRLFNCKDFYATYINQFESEEVKKELEKVVEDEEVAEPELVVVEEMAEPEVAVVEEVAEPEVVVVEEPAEPEVVVVEEVAEPLEESSLANIPRNYTKFIATEVVGKDSRLAWISYKYYGVKDFWVYIYEANLDRVSSPNYVKPGQKLRIPALDSKYTDLNDPEVQKLLLYLSQEYTKH
ncbi:MAG: hypothetical protein IKB40_03425 [Paludibacteraceae bacterium]|nr:hypothetical protein [Paludibacteraceae bacterium]